MGIWKREFLMPESLNDLSNTQAVIKAIEDNMASFWMNYGRAQGREAFEDGRLMHFTTGIAHPLFNAVFNARLTRSEIEPTIAEVVQHFSARKLPAFWWTGPGTLPSDLGEHLKRHGFQGGPYTAGMAVELSALPESVPAPDGFQMELVESAEVLRLWVEVVAAGNEMSPALHQPLYELESALGTQRYLGSLEGKPVAVSALHLDDGVAGIYAVATLPEARGKGIGGAITLQPLLDARKSGFNVGILQSSPMGHNVYKRLGFKDFCQLEVYFFSPE
jgi:GNAT superfamily N-acetyltransferase